MKSRKKLKSSYIWAASIIAITLGLILVIGFSVRGLFWDFGSSLAPTSSEIDEATAAATDYVQQVYGENYEVEYYKNVGTGLISCNSVMHFIQDKFRLIYKVASDADPVVSYIEVNYDRNDDTKVGKVANVDEVFNSYCGSKIKADRETAKKYYDQKTSIKDELETKLRELYGDIFTIDYHLDTLTSDNELNIVDVFVSRIQQENDGEDIGQINSFLREKFGGDHIAIRVDFEEAEE